MWNLLWFNHNDRLVILRLYGRIGYRESYSVRSNLHLRKHSIDFRLRISTWIQTTMKVYFRQKTMAHQSDMDLINGWYALCCSNSKIANTNTAFHCDLDMCIYLVHCIISSLGSRLLERLTRKMFWEMYRRLT